MKTKRENSPRRDDADVRGEHSYRSKRKKTVEPATEQVAEQRKPGHYIAGGEGTQEVVAPAEEQKPTDD